MRGDGTPKGPSRAAHHAATITSDMITQPFPGPRLKIRRANKHISDLYDMFVAFSNSNFYAMSVEENLEKRTHSLRLDIDTSGLHFEECAPIIGDVLHNLRSALDHLYFQVVLACDGKTTKWTKFPFEDSREGLRAKVEEALKQQRISREVANFLVDTIKPYQCGNSTLWGLHELNIVDKHESLIPVLKLMGFFGVHLEDENHVRVGRSDYIADESCLINLTGTYGRKITLKDKGRPSANIVFNIGASVFAGETVVPTLKRISEEVTRTVEAIEGSL